MLTQLRKSVSLYTLLALLIGVQGGILVFVHGFGNAGVDAIAGSILAGLALLTVVGHGFLNSLVIPIPGNVYAALSTVNGAIVAVLAASGMVVQYIGSVAPALTPWVALALQGFALIGSLLAGLFTVQTSIKQAKQAGFHVV